MGGLRRFADGVLLSAGVARNQLDNVKRALPSYIAQFELARELLGTEEQLIATIYRELYRGVECKLQLEDIPREYVRQIGWPRWRKILKALHRNQTLGAIGNLLVLSDHAKPRRNPQIHAVLTSNADNLLELYCAAKTEGRHVLNMIDRASIGEHPDQIPIYHLHGTLDARGENLFRPDPRSVPAEELQKVSGELLPELVFRESEYYETIANPASFVNHTPQSILRRLNVLFVGTSLDDLNMRRWLSDSFRERAEHRTKYLRELHSRVYPDAMHEARLESVRHFWIRTETEGLEKNKRWRVPRDYVDRVMRNLGVQVVWCSDYDDIVKCLVNLQKLGHDPEFGWRATD